MPLPTFVIAGERRCGTSSLAQWVSAHPDVYLDPSREPAYFLERELVGRRSWLDGEVDAQQWERTHSPDDYAELFARGSGAKAIGEKSADYFFWRPAHARIARYLPDTRFIVTLRHPTERAWSHYWNEVAKRRESLGFEAALAAEEERCASSAYARDHLSYRRRGFYDESVEAFTAHVERERMLLLTLEETRARPEETLSRIYRFLGVDPEQGLDAAGKAFNPNTAMVLRGWAEHAPMRPVARAYGRAADLLARLFTADRYARRALSGRLRAPFFEPAARVSMNPGTRARLDAEFAAHIERLESLLGRPLREWR